MQNRRSNTIHLATTGVRTVVATVAAALVIAVAPTGILTESASAAQPTSSVTRVESPPQPAGRAIRAGLPEQATDVVPKPEQRSGCVGLLSARQWQVLVFALAYCPSTWLLQHTSWGRGIVNWIVNVLCRQPWIVRAATGGRYSTC